MPRFLYGLIFLPLYIGWVIYRWLIKKDIRQHKNDFYGLSFFIAVWVLLYCAFIFLV